MGFFNDVGKAVKRTFANPTKLVGDIATGGLTAGLRILPKSIGGGQAGVFSKGTEVFGSSIIGGGTGIITGAASGAAVGGPYGAIVGAVYGGVAGTAAGFGSGVSGVAHGSSGRQLAVRASEFGAASGAVVGGVASFAAGTTGASAAGTGTSAATAAGTKTAVATTAAKSSFGLGTIGKGLEAAVPLAFLKSLQGNTLLPGTGGGSTGVTLNTGAEGTPTTTSNGPSNYPGVPSGLQTVDTGGPILAIAPKTNWLLYGSVGLLIAMLLLKKKHG